jgi:magnesium transporter
MAQNRPAKSQQLPSDSEEELDIDYSSPKVGAIPGTLDLEPDAPPPEIILIDYNEHSTERCQLNYPQECAAYLDTESVSWVDVLGLGNQETWRELGKVFQLHPLVQEDVVNVPQRPKVEEYEHQLVLIALMVILKPNRQGFYREQVSFILGKNYLLTVQEEPERDCFESVRDRIRLNKGIIRKQNADYLAYTLLDSIIDGYFPVLEAFGEQIEDLEDEVVANPTPQTLDKIYRIKRQLLSLRRAVWPQRDAINILIRDGSDLISHEVQIYLRDCYDHTVQVIDMVETYRELTSGLMDVYLSSISNRMNEIMKLLTVISSIFIPLTFIAGIYGMNFNTEKSRWNMPELNWDYGYIFCLGLMLVIAAGLVFFFWKRGWFADFSTIRRK